MHGRRHSFGTDCAFWLPNKSEGLPERQLAKFLSYHAIIVMAAVSSTHWRYVSVFTPRHRDRGSSQEYPAMQNTEPCKKSFEGELVAMH